MSDTFQPCFDFTAKPLPPEVQERIAEGMAQADANANVRWKRWIDGCIQDVARRMPEFTVDEVIAALEAIPDPPSTRNLAALGPRMKEVSQTLRYMEATDRVQRSKREHSHGNFLRVWKSLIWTGDDHA